MGEAVLTACPEACEGASRSHRHHFWWTSSRSASTTPVRCSTRPTVLTGLIGGTVKPAGAPPGEPSTNGEPGAEGRWCP